MPIFSVSGLASGLDTDTMIQKIMDFANRPIQTLETKIAQRQVTLASYKTLEARILAMQVDIKRLADTSSFNAKSVRITDDTVIGASVTSKALSGTFTLSVDRLAQTHQVASQGFADTNATTIGTGTFSIRVGSGQWLHLEIDDGNNTLEGLKDAINDAADGFSAAILNTGDADQPYRLLITAEETGSSHRIEIDADLTGGTAPAFGSVAPVVPGAKTGTSTISSSGSYTGDAGGTLNFTVLSGGTIGVDNITIAYDDGAGASGTFTIPSNYTAGEDIRMFAGLKLDFSAGTLDTDDTFSVDTTSSTIQAPLDALYTLGSGATGIPLVSESNTVKNLVEGLTVNLLKVSDDPITITVDNDVSTIKQYISDFVDQYNTFASGINEMLYYDGETETAGNLIGERTAVNLYNSIRGVLTGSVEGLSGTLNHLAELGVRIGSDGQLQIDESELDGYLEDNLKSVKNLFVADGQTTDGNIKFLAATGDTVGYTIGSAYPNGYAISITQAAESARLAGAQLTGPSVSSPLIIDDSNDTIKVKIDGVEGAEIQIEHGVYTSGDQLAEQLGNQLKLDDKLSNLGFGVEYVDDGGGLGHYEFYSTSYGSSSEVHFLTTSGSSLYSALGVAAGDTDVGKNVAGTINGESATGIGQYLTGDEDNEYTAGLRLLVTLTPAQLAAQGSDQGYVKVTKGVAQKFAEEISRLTDADSGKIALREGALQDIIDAYEEEKSNLEATNEKMRERLVREFARMEQAINELNNQSTMLSYYLGGSSSSNSSSQKSS